jgi:hypothetical protein
VRRRIYAALLLFSASLVFVQQGFSRVPSSAVEAPGPTPVAGLQSEDSNPRNEAHEIGATGERRSAGHDCDDEQVACGRDEKAGGQANPSSKVDEVQSPGIGPRYDVTRFGAVGNDSTDDTAAIQAAFTACWNQGRSKVSGKQGQGNYGGVVEFPGARIYVISSTIYAYDTCRMEGIVNFQTASPVRWNGPAAGAVYKINSFTVAANSRPYYPAYSPAPSPAPASIVTFPLGNSVKVNDWVLLQGFKTSAGVSINNTVAQVVDASGESFTVVVPFVPAATGTISDTGTATTINVMFASDTLSRYHEEIRDISFGNQPQIPKANRAGVDFYFGSRVDSGTKIWGAQADNPLYYGFYFSQGGIDVDFDKGWRGDEPGIAAIYWRITGGDNFGIANGTVSSNSGGTMLLDNSACSQGNMVRVTSRNMGLEVENLGLAPGLGEFLLLDCARDVFPVQFSIDMENTRTAADRGAVNYPTIVMNPPNDVALNLNIVNGIFPNGRDSNPTQRWVGMPALSRYDKSGAEGEIPSLVYSASLTSSGDLGVAYNNQRAMSQCLGDCNIGQLWQYGIHASAFLYSDAQFTALPNATTLYEGQIVAPPAYWGGTDGNRYAMNVVHRAGTTGVPNVGATACESGGRSRQIVCTSARDLSVGQHINLAATKDLLITRIDATDPKAVRLTVNKDVAAISNPVPLGFSPPVLGGEIQMPAKFQGVPKGGSWASGDMMQNAAAQQNGVAAWVDVANGGPGVWAGVPLGNDKGQIDSSQISDTTGSGDVVRSKSPTVSNLVDTGTTSLRNLTISGSCRGCSGKSIRTVQAFCTGKADSASTLTMFGAGGSRITCTSVVSAEAIAQLLMPTGGIVSNLAVRCAQSGQTGSSGVFSIWDLPTGTAMSDGRSGVNTGVTVTYGTSRANTTLFDSIHTFEYAQGDLLRIQFSTQANETLGDCVASFDY